MSGDTVFDVIVPPGPDQVTPTGRNTTSRLNTPDVALPLFHTSL